MENFSKFKWFILTGFYSGLAPKAPGTFGSVVGALIAYFAVFYFPNPNQTIMMLATLAAIAGYKLTKEYEAISQTHDDKRIVIDEIAGVLIAVGILGNLKEDTLLKITLAFLAFRLFDIWKPSIIGRIDKRQDAFGVMFDDILAGVFGGILAGIVYMGYLKLK
ncbi:MAG: phosphatidylglycerophosphatase A [Epsilonproteobacteria bacterium]|nr:phosphatidylglycerophosphatase A [Campylobacterota bacterium]